ncbi:hypothetical protein RB213_012473, partial [Colletotrichum asianum]
MEGRQSVARATPSRIIPSPRSPNAQYPDLFAASHAHLSPPRRTAVPDVYLQLPGTLHERQPAPDNGQAQLITAHFPRGTLTKTILETSRRRSCRHPSVCASFFLAAEPRREREEMHHYAHDRNVTARGAECHL